MLGIGMQLRGHCEKIKNQKIDNCSIVELYQSRYNYSLLYGNKIEAKRYEAIKS
jgi:hypothetical protein